MTRYTKNPVAGTTGRIQRDGTKPKSPSKLNCTSWPTVLQVRKRGRWVAVGKVVKLNGRPILATAIRHQQGTRDVVSMPLMAVEYAKGCDVRWWYYRNDRQHIMRRVRMSNLWDKGWYQGGELYIRLDSMELVPWQKWAYVEREVRLGKHEPPNRPAPEPEPVQLALGV